MNREKIYIIPCFTLTIISINGCGGGKYSDAEKATLDIEHLDLKN